MIGWSANEQTVLEDILSGEHSRRALEKFCTAKANFHRETCASLMESVPSRADEARNHAARATTYAVLIRELEEALRRE